MDFLDFSAYDVDTWTSFFKDNWFVLVIAIVVLLLIVRIVQTVVKWAIVAVIVIGVVLYSGYTMDDLKVISTKVVDSAKQEMMTAMAGDAKDAEFISNADGSYTIKTKNLELNGKPGDNEVTVSFRGAPKITIEVDSAIQAFIDQAKNNG
ncbi:hypothetical protein [Paenibacillus sp. YIM B09110]|jgi:hypothetical protein|uniref:hypothetical protein n=1 Tax=unclassified Paenibacillus TaxID=185978 RepID=UPI00301CE5E2